MTTTQTLGMSLALGVSLFSLTILFGWLSRIYGKIDFNFFKWIFLPTLGYGIALGINCALQYISCNSIKISQIAIGTIPVALSILVFLLISTLGIVQAPIQMALPIRYQPVYGTILAIAYYMFWAGMFGEAISGGFAQGCGS
jgi:hypothetical protein